MTTLQCRWPLLGVLLYSALSVLADTHYVDVNTVAPMTPYTDWSSASPAIQLALDQAVAGDTVLVANATYWVTNQINLTNGVVLSSVNNDPVNTIIARSNNCTTRVMRVNAEHAVVSGFCLSNGLLTGVADGAGVYLDNGTVSNCVITGNTLDTTFPPLTYGSGLCMVTGTVVDCVISENRSLQTSARGGVMAWAGVIRDCAIINNIGGDGSGIWMVKGLIQRCRIERNRSYGNGAGVCLSGAATMEYSTVISNRLLSQARGAGVYVVGGPVTIRHCTNSFNEGGWQQGGAGFHLAVSNTLIENCLITRNSGAGFGGGAYYALGGVMRNCLVAGNQVDMYGGGGVASEGPLVIENCTITHNKGSAGISARCNAGGLFMTTGSVVNCIIHSNTTATAGKEANFYFTDQVAISNTCGMSSTLSFPDGVNGNFMANPRFKGEGSGYGSSWVGGDYHLGMESACVDRGQNLSWMHSVSDLDGAVRIQSEYADIGAYESPAPSGSSFKIR